MPVLTGSVYAHILTKPSRAGFAVIRLELIELGAETCVYQAKACSPTDQRVRKFKHGLGINMTMKTSLLEHITSCEKHGVGVPAAWYPQRRSRPMPSRTHSSNLHVIYRWSALPWGSAVGLKVSARCNEAIRSHVDGWVSCELQLYKRGYIRYVYCTKLFFFIFRLMTCTDVCFFSLSGVLFPRE